MSSRADDEGMDAYRYEVEMEPFEVMEARRELEAALADSLAIEQADRDAQARMLAAIRRDVSYSGVSA